MSDHIEHLVYKGFDIYIKPDEAAESPRTWDNLGVMIGDRNLIAQDANDVFENDPLDYFIESVLFESDKANALRDMMDALGRDDEQIREALESRMNDTFLEDVVVYAVKAFTGTQSCIHYSEGCPDYDDNPSGIYYCDLAMSRKNWGQPEATWETLIPWRDNTTITMREATKRVLEGEIDTLNCFFTGNVYYWIVKDEDGEVIDSCGGYYEKDFDFEYMISDAKCSIECHLDSLRVEREKRQLQLSIV